MVLAGIKVPDTVLVRDAIDLSRSASEPFLFNHSMRSWLFSVLLSESAERAPDANSRITLDVYTRAISATKREANNRVMTTVLEAGKKVLPAPSKGAKGATKKGAD